MYSFSGWNAATYIIGDTAAGAKPCRARCWRDADRARVYVALNAVFLHTAPIDKLAASSTSPAFPAAMFSARSAL
jgi:APA family basic amino acid/polyamine antiporter